MQDQHVDLVIRLQQGDDKAFEQLYELHRKQVWLYCLKIVSDRELASDVFQETFIRIYQKSGSFRGTGSITGWIFRIARNACYDALRRQKSHPSVSDVDDMASPANSYDNIEDREQLGQALDQLTREQKEIILLREIQGFSYKDIAQLTGASLASVKVRLFRARERLRSVLHALE